MTIEVHDLSDLPTYWLVMETGHRVVVSHKTCFSDLLGHGVMQTMETVHEGEHEAYTFFVLAETLTMANMRDYYIPKTEAAARRRAAAWIEELTKE